MTPKERAREILSKEEKNWRLIGAREKSIWNFAMSTAKNTIAELEFRRKEIFKPEEPEYQKEYWQQVKQHIQSL